MEDDHRRVPGFRRRPAPSSPPQRFLISGLRLLARVSRAVDQRDAFAARADPAI
ncbi:MAG: hypothetical protein M3127_04085 [Actinomycetota bacterium]|nr:hypothetical protein [Actinomycetota bacterium]